MKKILAFVAIIMLFISGCQPVQPPPPPVNGTKNPQLSQLALVIGNSQYEYSQLANPINDATDIANFLKKIGFEVTLKTDLNQIAMGEAIRRFTARMSQNPGVGLFYFAGHGAQVDGHNYLLPIDNNKIGDKHDLQSYAVDVDNVLARMEEARSHLNLIILDACRDDPFSGARSRTLGRGLARMETSGGTIIAFATDKGNTADDRSVNGRNGLFTSHLLSAIEKTYQKQQRIDDMFMQVRNAVKRESGGEQIPWYSASLETPFCFRHRTGIDRCSRIEQSPSDDNSHSPTPTARYTDNRDGTITDNRTRLIWLKNANCFGEQYWKTAIQSVANLAHGQCDLQDGSRAGKWRLPTKEEWETMVDKNYIDSNNYSQPTLSNAAGTGPWKKGDPFYQVQPVYYWSGTRTVGSTNNVWYVDMSSGDVNFNANRLTGYVWPVRGGH